MLKPQDVLIVLKLFTWGHKEWTYEALASSLFMSASEAHAGIKRAQAAGLVHEGRTPIVESCKEFAVHGVRYAFFAERGALTRGMPTSVAASPLAALFGQQGHPVLVWPCASGTVRGEALTPLYKTVPKAAEADPSLYELLVLVDALRVGRARERSIATELLRQRMDTYRV